MILPIATNDLKTVNDEISERYALSGFVRPEIPPRDFDNPDASIQINGNAASALIVSSIQPLIAFSGGTIDTRKTNEKRVILYTPRSENCPYSQGHTVNIALLSRADRAKRTIFTQSSDVWTLDTIDIWSAPAVRLSNGNIFIDVAVQIGYVQDIDWSGSALILINGIIQRKVNPSLPNPLFSLPIDKSSLPDSAKISKAAIRIDGCWYQEPSVVIDIKFA